MDKDEEVSSLNQHWSEIATSTLHNIWHLQIAWGLISFILGVTGNIFILYATNAHNAIKLDKMSIWIIKNLAVADFCNCVLIIFPILLNQFGKVDGLIIYEETFNVIMGCYRYLFFVANLFLVNILSLNKLLRCIFPLRNLVATRRQKNMVTITTVIISIVPTCYIAYGVSEEFESISRMWAVDNYLGAAHIGKIRPVHDRISSLNLVINRMVLIIFNAFPCLTLVVFNSSLVIFALLKTTNKVNKMNILIVILVTIAFFLSVLPHFVNIMLEENWNGTPEEAKEVTWSVSYISTWINPIIYLAVNPSFRSFTVEKLSFRQNPATP